MLKKHLFAFFFLAFILLDTGYSFIQYYHEPLDGDIASIILPAPAYQQVLEDPIGWIALTEQKKCAGPNRYFAHQFMYTYFRNMPLLFQSFLNPIDSVYASNALLKIVIHLLFLFCLTAYSNFLFISKKLNWLIAAILLVPLFQTAGYNRSFGVIDHSITYTVFYALPIAILLLFFWPFWKKIQIPNYQISNKQLIISFLLMIVLTFNGPLINPLILIICPSVLLFLFYKSFKNLQHQKFNQKIKLSLQQIPRQILLPFSLFTLLSCYSFYLGTYNIESSKAYSLWDRYQAIPIGIYYQFTRKIGFMLLAIFIIFNTLRMRKYKYDRSLTNTVWKRKIKNKRSLSDVVLNYSFPETRYLSKSHNDNENAKTLLRHYRWIGLFCLVYILLLPLGGYRDYRPNILRTDTIIPINICLFYYFTSSTLFLLTKFQSKQKSIFRFSIAVLLFIFTIADEPNFNKNQCEKDALKQLQTSSSNTNLLPSDCTIMAWTIPIEKAYAIQNGKMLYLWGITSKPMMYHQE